MKEMMKYLKWIVYCQLAGIICTFIAFWLPYENDNPIKAGLFIFGIVLTFAYWVYLYLYIYKPLKDKNE